MRDLYIVSWAIILAEFATGLSAQVTREKIEVRHTGRELGDGFPVRTIFSYQGGFEL